MIGPSGAVRVMLATRPVDFRKGMDGLAALVRDAMGADPFSGTVNVFRSKRADRVKLLVWEARRVKRRTNRGALPAHLPRVECLVDIDSTACPCCSGALHRIGEDVSERLDVVPAQFRVLVIRRPRYACRACGDAIVQAPAPVRLIEGGLPTDALVAQVLVSKYADHLPMYRQAQIFARQGVSLDRSTLVDWVGRAAFLLRPVHGRLLETLTRSGRLFADETTAPVLDPGRGRTKTGQLWAYARDDRPWGGTDPPGVAYFYAPDRTAGQPIAHLSGFAGVLQVDGYAAYESLARGGAVRLAHCWSPVRRQFYDLAAASPIATEALSRIAALYRIEAEIRGRPAEERRAARQERSRPVISARVSGSRKFQMVLASGTGSDSPNPRKRINKSRFLIRNLGHARPTASGWPEGSGP